MHPSPTAVVEAARAVGLDITIRNFPEGTRTAADAARAVGCDVGQIVKSLVFMVDDLPVMALVSGRNQLDERLLAAAAGGERVRRASADEVRDATGYPIGGVPPLGLGKSLRTFADEDLYDYSKVWAAAGTPRDVFGVAPEALVSAIGGTRAQLARSEIAPET